MISDKNVAQQILPLLESAIRNLSKATNIAANELPVDEYKNFKKQAGTLIGDLGHELIHPIHLQHPELDQISSK